MIGPMYLVEEFPEFINLNIDNSNNEISSYSSLNFFDSIKFCSELEYNGYDDWYLPSFDQILMYYSKNGNFIIPNYDDATTNTFWTKQFSEQNEFLVVEISGNNFMNIVILP